MPDYYAEGMPKRQVYNKAKVIKLVTDVTTVDCDIRDLLEKGVPYCSYENSFRVGEHELGIPRDKVKEIDFKEIYNVCPVHTVITGYSTLSEVVHNEHYIAYTPKIEKLFKLPYEMMRAELRSLNYQIIELNGALTFTEEGRNACDNLLKAIRGGIGRYEKSFWKRFKFLFTGKF